MVKPLIVGIDVGTTSGIAVFDLKRNLLYSGSKRGFSTSEIINKILNFGKPLIIATDKKKAPSKINKIAASFNCKVFSPDHDLSVEEKESIVKISIKNSHEKDALAAALFAYRRHGAKFTSIDRTLAIMNLEKFSDRVKEMIINKEAKNISEAIEMIKPKKEEKVKQVFKEVKLDWKEKAKEYKKKLSEQKRSYEILKLYADRLEEKRYIDKTITV
jgi:predicted RNase H-like nuclease (RuvC/YqgF family)